MLVVLFCWVVRIARVYIITNEWERSKQKALEVAPYLRTQPVLLHLGSQNRLSDPSSNALCWLVWEGDLDAGYNMLVLVLRQNVRKVDLHSLYSLNNAETKQIFGLCYSVIGEWVVLGELFFYLVNSIPYSVSISHPIWYIHIAKKRFEKSTTVRILRKRQYLWG